MIAGTNFELYYLSAVVALLKRKDNSFDFKLMLRRNFKDNITPEIRSLYSKIDLFEIPALTPPLSKNPLKMVYNIFENLFQYLIYRRDLKKHFSEINIVCIAGFREFFASVLCRLAPKKVRVIAIRLANQKMENTKNYKERPLFSFLLNIKNRLLGYSAMDYHWRIDLKNELVTKKFIKYPYHRTILITDYNIGSRDSEYRLPPPLVSLKSLYKREDEKPAILVAGDKTPVHPNWNKEEQKKYEEFLDYLRNNFKDHILYFKPKIGRTDPNKYSLSGFQLSKAEVSLEEICLRKNITKVISIRSTSSKVGIYFGIPGYMLYPIFNMSEDFKQTMENEHDDMHSIIKVNKFEDLQREPELFVKKYSFDDLTSLYWEAIIAK